MDGTWTLALRIVSPKFCQLATEVIKRSWNLEYHILQGFTPTRQPCPQRVLHKLARLWTHNPECQGSSPIQVRYLHCLIFNIQSNFSQLITNYTRAYSLKNKLYKNYAEGNMFDIIVYIYLPYSNDLIYFFIYLFYRKTPNGRNIKLLVLLKHCLIR